MKMNINLKGIFVVMMLGLLIFTGCAEKKSVVTSDSGQSQQGVSDTATPPQDASASKDVVSQDTTDKSVDLEKMARAKSPVSDIHFEYDSSSINAEAREILKANANYFMRNRVSSIIIEGHCDERGTDEYNMALGERRATVPPPRAVRQ